MLARGENAFRRAHIFHFLQGCSKDFVKYPDKRPVASPITQPKLVALLEDEWESLASTLLLDPALLLRSAFPVFPSRAASAPEKKEATTVEINITGLMGQTMQ